MADWRLGLRVGLFSAAIVAIFGSLTTNIVEAPNPAAIPRPASGTIPATTSALARHAETSGLRSAGVSDLLI